MKFQLLTIVDMITFLQVSADLSIVDIDIPFSLIFSVAASINAGSNLGVITVVTWEVLFVAIPMIYLAILLQVKNSQIVYACNGIVVFNHVERNTKQQIIVLNICIDMKSLVTSALGFIFCWQVIRRIKYKTTDNNSMQSWTN